MAQSQQPERDGEAEFVRRIVTDPRNVPDVMRLYGYPGASSEEHHDRLYLNPDLSQYVEVPRNAILHRMAVPAEQDPNGAVVLWVRRDAALVYKSAPAAQALANYFAGAIAGAAAGGAAMPAIYYCAPTEVHPCTVTCPQTPALPCPSHVPCLTYRTCATCVPFCRVTLPPACYLGAVAEAAAAGVAPAAAAAQLPFSQVYICQTREQPWCPYPTEVCTIAGPACHTRHPPMCGLPAAAAGAAAMPGAAIPFVPFHTPACSLAFCHPSHAMALCPPLSAFCEAAGAAQAAAPFLATPGFGCPWTAPPNCPPHTFQAGCTQVAVICHCIGQTVPK